MKDLSLHGAAGQDAPRDLPASENLLLRRATEQDAPAVADAESQIFPDAWSLSAIRATLLSPISTSAVATDAGGALLAYCLSTAIGPEGEILRIAALPPFRRRGIGKALLSFVSQAQDTLFLEVRAQNAPALALYRSFGFSEIGRRKNYYRNPTDDAILLRFDRPKAKDVP